MSQEFDVFMSQLVETNATLDYFTDFEKVRNNTQSIAIKLHQLNYLIGKTNLRSAIKELYKESPQAFDVLDILIAIRKQKKTKILNMNNDIILMESYFSNEESIFEYIQETGLAQVFQNKNITNLIDYVFGIEVGLDTNARKNRSGKNMVKAVEKQFMDNEILYDPEIFSNEIPALMSLGVDKKKFDLVIKTKQKTYLIEINFYNTGGSKLNEVARAYAKLARNINQYEDFEFVWITDGKGWNSAKQQLKEAFSIIPKIYNLHSLQSFIALIKKEGVISLDL